LLLVLLLMPLVGPCRRRDSHALVTVPSERLREGSLTRDREERAGRHRRVRARRRREQQRADHSVLPKGEEVG
jgi:hypothetical protein